MSSLLITEVKIKKKKKSLSQKYLKPKNGKIVRNINLISKIQLQTRESCINLKRKICRKKGNNCKNKL